MWGFPLTTSLSDGAATTEGEKMIALESGISHSTDGACVPPIPLEKYVHPPCHLCGGSSQELQQWSRSLCAALCTTAQQQDDMPFA